MGSYTSGLPKELYEKINERFTTIKTDLEKSGIVLMTDKFAEHPGDLNSHDEIGLVALGSEMKNKKWINRYDVLELGISIDGKKSGIKYSTWDEDRGYGDEEFHEPVNAGDLCYKILKIFNKNFNVLDVQSMGGQKYWDYEISYEIKIKNDMVEDLQQKMNNNKKRK